MDRLFFPLLLLYTLASSIAAAEGETSLAYFEKCIGEAATDAEVRNINHFGDIELSGGTTLSIADTHFLTSKTDEFLSAEAHAFLNKRLVGQSIIYFKTQKPDRYKRLPSQIWFHEKDNLLSLQEELYRQRLGVFMPSPSKSSINNGACSRKENKPLYRDPPNAKYFSASNRALWNQEGEFVIVTGVVKSVYHGKSATNWNFGDNWRHDFSISIPNAIKLYEEHDKELNGKIIGKSVRIRGYLDLANGPFIRIDHPGQIELKD